MTKRFLTSSSWCLGALKSFLATRTPSTDERKEVISLGRVGEGWEREMKRTLEEVLVDDAPVGLGNDHAGPVRAYEERGGAREKGRGRGRSASKFRQHFPLQLLNRLHRSAVLFSPVLRRARTPPPAARRGRVDCSPVVPARLDGRPPSSRLPPATFVPP